MLRHLTLCARGLLLVLPGLMTLTPSSAEAGDYFRKRARPVVAACQPVDNDPSATLGTFSTTPYMFVRGNAPAGGGYSPLGLYGDQTMALYGPLSPLRATSAPVLTYSRGYDGRPVVSEGTSFSTPNLPSLTPVVYPTQATYYYRFRESGEPPWWANASNWIDQN